MREAFRLLEHDGLLVHEPNRGAFVPQVTPLDVRDIYRVRRVLEPAVVRGLTELDVPRMQALTAAVDAARSAAAVGFGMFETLEILGPEASLARIDRALALAEQIRDLRDQGREVLRGGRKQ